MYIMKRFTGRSLHWNILKFQAWPRCGCLTDAYVEAIWILFRFTKTSILLDVCVVGGQSCMDLEAYDHDDHKDIADYSLPIYSALRLWVIPSHFQ